MNFFSLFKRKFLYKIKKKINVDFDSYNDESLDGLFHYYGSDKANIFKKNNDQGHGFSRFYTKKFDHLKNKKVKILEIGSFAGASAAAFSKYFKNASIYCFDINISKFIYSSKKIQVYGLDIKNKNELNKTLKRISIESKSNLFDIIIDDGSHYLKDILLGLKFLFKHLNQGGIYVIEDFKHPNYYKYNKDIDHIFIDQVLTNLKKKELFNSSIISNEEQLYLQNEIEIIDIFKGNLEDSDICFIKKIK